LSVFWLPQNLLPTSFSYCLTPEILAAEYCKNKATLAMWWLCIGYVMMHTIKVIVATGAHGRGMCQVILFSGETTS
jgi:hypothetical protein